MMANRMLPRAGVALALAAAVGLAVWNHTLTVAAGQPVPQPGAVPVSTVLRACPAPGLTGSPATHLALLAGPASGGAGRAVVTYSGASQGAPLLSLSQPGVLSLTRVRSVPAPATAKTAHGKTAHATASPSPPSGQAVTTVPAQGGVVIQATGSMARGLETEQVADSGKVVARCEGPGTDFWFAGPGIYSAPRIYLYLMNPGSQPADVNVQAFTDAGPLVGSTDSGVAVAPHTMVVQSLGKMLHGARAMALHVRTSVGQVVAAVEEITGSARGGAWLPASVSPATRVVLPGMPPTAGTRQLFVTVPGTQDATVTLHAITSKGSYVPTGGAGVDIPGGSVVEVSLASLSAISGALQVSSNVPVTATLLVPGGPAGTPGAFTAASGAIQEQGVAAANVSGGGMTSALVLSAPGRAVQARVTQIAAGSSAQAATNTVVRIAAQHSVVVKLGRASASHGTAFAVVVTLQAGSGPLYAGRVISASGKGGALQSILPMASALTAVPLPGVRSALISPGG